MALAVVVAVAVLVEGVAVVSKSSFLHKLNNVVETNFNLNKKKLILILLASFFVGMLVGYFIAVNKTGNDSISITKAPLNLDSVEVKNPEEIMDPAYAKQKIFLGKWEGVWGDRKNTGVAYFELPAVFVVSDILSPEKLKVTYSWGSNSFLKIKKGVYETEASFNLDGTISIKLEGAGDKEGAIIIFKSLDSVGSVLYATYHLESEIISQATFLKKQ